jgi:FkbM family methyltransferase
MSPPIEADTRVVVPDVTTLVLGGHEVRLVVDKNATDQYTEWIRHGAGTEPPLQWSQRFVQPGWQVLDLGANLGTFSLPIAHECRRVIAVEAMPDNASLLTKSVALSGLPVVPVHAAVWDRPGTVAMAGSSAWARVQDRGTLTVPALTVRDLVAAYADGPVDLVKVDIEGGEATVLPQILELADGRSEFVVIYESNQAVNDQDVRVMHRAVAAAGFDLWYLDPATGDAFSVDLTTPQFTLNCDVLAVKGAATARPDRAVMSDELLAERVANELSAHPVLIHRSYAHVAAEHLAVRLRDHPTLLSAMARPPDHSAAAAEMTRFRATLRSA